VDTNKYKELDNKGLKEFSDDDLACVLFTRFKESNNPLLKEALIIHRALEDNSNYNKSSVSNNSVSNNSVSNNSVSNNSVSNNSVSNNSVSNNSVSREKTNYKEVFTIKRGKSKYVNKKDKTKYNNKK